MKKFLSWLHCHYPGKEFHIEIHKFWKQAVIVYLAPEKFFTFFNMLPETRWRIWKLYQNPIYQELKRHGVRRTQSEKTRLFTKRVFSWLHRPFFVALLIIVDKVWWTLPVKYAKNLLQKVEMIILGVHGITGKNGKSVWKRVNPK